MQVEQGPVSGQITFAPLGRYSNLLYPLPSYYRGAPAREAVDSVVGLFGCIVSLC